MIKKLTVAFLALLGCGEMAPASLRSPHDVIHSLNFTAWNSTHIVVVTEGDKIDGVLEVVESWKGDLKKGQKLTFPELARFSSLESRAVQRSRDDFASLLPSKNKEQLLLKGIERKVSHVTCSRMILFLVRQQAPHGKSGVKWLPGSMTAEQDWPGAPEPNVLGCAAWVENRLIYYCDDIWDKRPGIYAAAMTEAELKQKIKIVLSQQAAVEKAIKQGSSARIRDVLLPILRADPGGYKYSFQVLRQIVGSSAAGLEAIRALLDDPVFAKSYPLLFNATTAQKVSLPGPYLVQLLDRETTFWREKAKTLQVGWWSTMGPASAGDELMDLIGRFGMGVDIVRLLGESAYSDGRRAVIEYEALLDSLPQLGQIGWSTSGENGKDSGWRDFCARARTNLSLSDPAQVHEAWNATHIVVGTQKENRDGTVVVLESWKGDLKKGDILNLPILSGFVSIAARKIDSSSSDTGQNRGHPQYVTGARMILFLTPGEPDTPRDQKPATPLKPVLLRGSGVEPFLAWVESDRVYALAPAMYNTPRRLLDTGMTEEAFKNKVEGLLTMRDKLLKAVAERSTVKLDAAIDPILRADPDAMFLGSAALKALAHSGKAAIPVFQRILKDSSLKKHHVDAEFEASRANLPVAP